MTATGTIPNRLKAGIIDALTMQLADLSIEIVDGTQRDTPPMPCIVVQVTSAEQHSEALRDIQRINVEVILMVHYGDDEESQINEWIDAIEMAVADGAVMQEIATNGIRIFDWKFLGAIESWMEEIHATTFSIDTIATRFLTQRDY